MAMLQREHSDEEAACQYILLILRPAERYGTPEGAGLEQKHLKGNRTRRFAGMAINEWQYYSCVACQPAVFFVQPGLNGRRC